jgi:hypothetical protein
MAAADKAENLSLVVHGPGDIRLVKGKGGWGAYPTLPPSPLSRAAVRDPQFQSHRAPEGGPSPCNALVAQMS